MLWGCTLREARQRCDAREFVLWQALWNIEPWGEERADYRSAIIAHTVALCNGGKGLKLDDFRAYPPTVPPERRQSAAQQAAIAKAIAAMNRGK